MSLGTNSNGGWCQTHRWSSCIYIKKYIYIEIRQKKKAAEILGDSGCEEKCESCIIYLESCNLSIRVSVRMALCTVIDHAVKPQTRDFTAQMPPELHVQMKRWVAAEPFFILCCENVWTRRGALPLVDAFTVKKQQKQLWLFFSTQVGLRWPRSPLTADVPDQFKRLSAQRGGLLTVSFLFFLHLSGWLNEIWTVLCEAACVV